MKRLSPLAALETVSSARLIAVLLSVFAAAELAYHAAGLTFDTRSLPVFSQYLDVPWLRSRLLESLLYQHGQPPAFNLFLGVVLKVFGDRAGVAWHLLYVAAGAVLCVSVFLVSARVAGSKVPALIVSTVLAVSPVLVLYEHWLFYAFPVAAALLAAAAVLDRLLRAPRARLALLFFSLLALVCLTWSLVNLVYLLVVALGLARLAPRARRAVLVGAALPLAIVAAVYAKNLVLFGFFGPSSWVGMSLARMTVRNVPADELRRLVAAGALSPLALLESQPGTDRFPPALLQPGRFAGIDALTQPRKSSGATNYNHIVYVHTLGMFTRDALSVLRLYPRAYALGARKAWRSYFRASIDNLFLRENAERVGAWNLRRVLEARPDLGRILVLTGVVGWALFSALRPADGGLAGPDGPRRLVLLFLCFTILYVAGVGNSIEWGENNRFRFTTDPMAAALTAVALRDAVLAIRRRWPWRSAGAD